MIGREDVGSNVPRSDARNPATLRNWIEAEARATRPAGADDSDPNGAELRRLRQEVAELRRANEILKTASAFFAQAELDRRLR